MDEMNKKRIEVLKLQYPKGCTVELVYMDDEQAPPKGTKGVVIQVDDIGTYEKSDVMESKPCKSYPCTVLNNKFFP